MIIDNNNNNNCQVISFKINIAKSTQSKEFSRSVWFQISCFSAFVSVSELSMPDTNTNA